AFTTLQEHAWTPAERRAYVRSMIARTDREMQMSYARRKGLEKGREEGREEGLAEGEKKGREEGREEGLRQGKLDMARNLLKSGTDPKAIAAASGLALPDIDKLERS
ncbi:MAG: hypothetical protein AAF471_08065, partial [Myxococcota bacterium]